MKYATYACLSMFLAVSACNREDQLVPIKQQSDPVLAGRGAREAGDSITTVTTYNNEPSQDFDSFTNPRLLAGVPSSLNRTLVGTYDKDWNAFDAIAGVTYTITLGNFNPDNLPTSQVRIEGYLPNVVSIFRTPENTTTVQFTATQSVTHTIVVADRNSDFNFGNSLGDYTITVTSNGPVQQTNFLSKLTLSATSVVGGTALTGTVTLSGPAPTGGALVTLTSISSPGNLVSVPASILVPAGASSQSFPIGTTQPVRRSQLAAITAKYAGRSYSANLTVTRR